MILISDFIGSWRETSMTSVGSRQIRLPWTGSVDYEVVPFLGSRAVRNPLEVFGIVAIKGDGMEVNYSITRMKIDLGE